MTSSTERDENAHPADLDKVENTRYDVAEQRSSAAAVRRDEEAGSAEGWAEAVAHDRLAEVEAELATYERELRVGDDAGPPD